MESNSEADRVNMSKDAAQKLVAQAPELVRQLEKRANVQVKGKGLMTVRRDATGRHSPRAMAPAPFRHLF